MESQVGYERLFDPQDIFFSTTDLKGVIQNTNRTFDTLSRYSRERLIGAPHNIIRHLDMPAGLFRLIWDDLQSQRPACGYITNRAVDGLDYRVFATIVPLRQGYLSVRIKPMDAETRNKVEEVYRRVRAKERDLEARGASRHQLGEFGGRELATELTALGFSSLHDMTLATLPREVAALVGSGVRVPAAAPESLGAVARILNTVAAMEKDTNALVFELDEYLRLITTMEATHGSVRAVEVRVGRIGQLVSHDAGNGTQTYVSRHNLLPANIAEMSASAPSGWGTGATAASTTESTANAVAEISPTSCSTCGSWRTGTPVPVLKVRVRACTAERTSFSAARVIPACTASSTSWTIADSGSLTCCSSGSRVSTGTLWNVVEPVPVSCCPNPSQSSKILTPECWVETKAIWRPARAGWLAATATQSA